MVSCETRRVAPITLDVMWDHFLSATGRSCRRTFRYRNLSVMPAASDDDFAGLTATFYQSEQLLWSEQWLVRYRDMDFIQNVLTAWQAAAHVWMPCVTPGTI